MTVLAQTCTDSQTSVTQRAICMESIHKCTVGKPMDKSLWQGAEGHFKVLGKRACQPTLGGKQSTGGCFASQDHPIIPKFLGVGRTTSFSPPPPQNDKSTGEEGKGDVLSYHNTKTHKTPSPLFHHFHTHRTTVRGQQQND